MVIEPGFCFLWAILALVLPLKWLGAVFLAAVLHELGHFLALRLFGVVPSGFRLGMAGAELEIPELSYQQEFVCALAGPTVSFSLLLLRRWFPQLSVCGFVHGGFNLLPIYPLDGGRMLRAIAAPLLSPGGADKLLTWVKYGVLGLLVLVFAILHWWEPVAYLLLLVSAKGLFGKIPCKRDKLRVQ